MGNITLLMCSSREVELSSGGLSSMIDCSVDALEQLAKEDLHVRHGSDEREVQEMTLGVSPRIASRRLTTKEVGNRCRDQGPYSTRL